jgi:hypothetical protein
MVIDAIFTIIASELQSAQISLMKRNVHTSRQDWEIIILVGGMMMIVLVKPLIL